MVCKCLPGMNGARLHVDVNGGSADTVDRGGEDELDEVEFMVEEEE